jgi:penicillin-binding protein 1B
MKANRCAETGELACRSAALYWVSFRGDLVLLERIHRYRWALAALLVALLVLSVLGIRTLSYELESKFHAAADSVPTRVYSSVYWIKPGVGASLEELRFRLKERDYHETAPENVKGPGAFSLQADEAGRPSQLTVFTNNFSYPQLAREAIFGNPNADIHPSRYVVSWKGGFVARVADSNGSEVAGGFALEPVVVAQLNQGNTEARKAVPLGQIPHTLMEGIVLTEDQRFLEHGGIDPRGIARSLWVNLRSGGYVQGASTITQQLAKNIYLTRQRTLSRKIKEMLMSIFLELRFSKDEILEKYLNEVYFGQSGNISIHGVAEAAKFYFNKQLEELSIAEQALIAGLVKGPFYYSPYRHFDRAKTRQEIVLGKMRDAGVITEQQFKAAVAERLHFARVSLVQNRAPYFTDMVQAQLLKDLPEQEAAGMGYTIFSTLDTYYQQLAEAAVAAGVGRVEANIKKFVELERKRKAAKMKKKGAAPADAAATDDKDAGSRLVEGVFVAVDPATGHLLSLVGGRSYEESTFNRALLMRRHIGSLVKPFVYLSALVYGRNPDGTPMSAISKFEDKPYTYDYDGKSWSPKNFEDEFAGTVTMRYALAHSINTVAAQVAIGTGLDNLVHVARAAGFETDLQPLPSLSLGAQDVAPMEVATAYDTIANYGLRREITSTLAVVGDEGQAVAKFQPREERSLPQDETANLVDLMTSVFEIGTAHPARIAGFTWPAAGKTGTTSEFRDAWFAGFTTKILGISWIGFDRDDEIVRKNRKALSLTGAVAALPVWTQFMIAAHRNQEPRELVYPDGILRRLRVDLISGGRASPTCMGESVVEETFTNRNVPVKECN